MTAPMVDYKIHWLKMMSVPESRAVVGRHDGINGRDSLGGEVLVEKVRCDGLVVLAVRRLFELLFPFCRQLISPHQPSHPMASNLDPILGSCLMEPLTAP